MLGQAMKGCMGLIGSYQSLIHGANAIICYCLIHTDLSSFKSCDAVCRNQSSQHRISRQKLTLLQRNTKREPSIVSGIQSQPVVPK